MDKSKIKVIALDLDGTLTQHKQPLSPEARATLTALSEKYKLLMVGAGQVQRIFNQMEHFPIDIIRQLRSAVRQIQRGDRRNGRAAGPDAAL